MKKIDWKNLFITCLVTIMPMLIGIIFYNQLPEIIPVHFNIHNQPDTFTSKEIALFGIPAILMIVQIVICVIIDIRRKEDAEVSKLETIMRWVMPIISVLVGVLLVEYPLRIRLDLRMYICVFLGILFIVTGYYFPKMSYESAKGKMKPYPKDEKSYNILTKVLSYTFIVFGIMMIFSMRFMPVTSIIILGASAVVILIETLYFGFRKPKEIKK